MLSFLLQKGCENSQCYQNRTPVKTDIVGLKTEGFGLKTEINTDVLILNSSPYKISDFSASHIDNMKRHFDTMSKGLEPYQCQLCDYSFMQAGDLKKHVDAIHKVLKPNQYKLCNYSAKNANLLKRHVNAAHDRLKLYQCKLCDYSTQGWLGLNQLV